MDPDYAATKPGLPAIMGRPVDLVRFHAAIDNLCELYATAQRPGFTFNAVWVPASFSMAQLQPFDPGFSQALYEVGCDIGMKGNFRETCPPRQHRRGGTFCLVRGEP